MKIANIKILKKNPSVCIDRDWFPFRNIVNQISFDGDLCGGIEDAIQYNGKRKVIVYYEIKEKNSHNQPIKILAGYQIKGKPYDVVEYLYNTIYATKPLEYSCSLGFDPDTDPFIYKHLASPEDYIDNEKK